MICMFYISSFRFLLGISYLCRHLFTNLASINYRKEYVHAEVKGIGFFSFVIFVYFCGHVVRCRVNLMFHYFSDHWLNRNRSAKLMHTLRIIETVLMNVTKCNDMLHPTTELWSISNFVDALPWHSMVPYEANARFKHIARERAWNNNRGYVCNKSLFSGYEVTGKPGIIILIDYEIRILLKIVWETIHCFWFCWPLPQIVLRIPTLNSKEL